MNQNPQTNIKAFDWGRTTLPLRYTKFILDLLILFLIGIGVLVSKQCVKGNVFKTKSVIELEKLLIYGSLIVPVVKPWLNKWCYKYIIYILLKLKIILRILYNIKIIAFHFFLHLICLLNDKHKYKCINISNFIK